MPGWMSLWTYLSFMLWRLLHQCYDPSEEMKRWVYSYPAYLDGGETWKPSILTDYFYSRHHRNKESKQRIVFLQLSTLRYSEQRRPSCRFLLAVTACIVYAIQYVMMLYWCDNNMTLPSKNYVKIQYCYCWSRHTHCPHPLPRQPTTKPSPSFVFMIPKYTFPFHPFNTSNLSQLLIRYDTIRSFPTSDRIITSYHYKKRCERQIRQTFIFHFSCAWFSSRVSLHQ